MWSKNSTEGLFPLFWLKLDSHNASEIPDQLLGFGPNLVTTDSKWRELAQKTPECRDRHHGGQPRGAYIYKEFRNTFQGGKVTIAATSFLRTMHPRKTPYPPRGHLTLQFEQQKLPPIK